MDHSGWSGDKDSCVTKGVRPCLHGTFFTRGIWGFGGAKVEVPPVQDSASARGDESVCNPYAFMVEWPLPSTQERKLSPSSWFVLIVTAGSRSTEPGLDSAKWVDRMVTTLLFRYQHVSTTSAH